MQQEVVLALLAKEPSQGYQLRGKSTLLHLLGGLERPSAGTIELAGQPVSDRSERCTHPIFAARRSASSSRASISWMS
jgi:ABC-type sulfate/molybdate transport systems ATPase subunit